MVNQIEEQLKAIQTTIDTLNIAKTKENEKEITYKIAELISEEYKILKELRIK